MSSEKALAPAAAAIGAAFDRIAGIYDRHAALEREVGDRLLERLAFQRREPQRIVDLGSGTGHCSLLLKRRFRAAEVIGLDASLGMSRQLRKRSSRFRPLRPVVADLARLPLAERSADLLFSNLALQWCTDFAALWEDFRRVLRPGGLLLFSTLGPDSLQELRLAGGYEPDSPRARRFADMHDIGDTLLAAGFSQPVMDSEHITFEYRRFETLAEDLEATGAGTHFADWGDGSRAGSALEHAYRSLLREGRYPLTWEVLYGVAYGPEEGQPVKSRQGDVAAFSVDHLRKSLPRR
jgi:malonyl-CoA O-methyltransferase